MMNTQKLASVVLAACVVGCSSSLLKSYRDADGGATLPTSTDMAEASAGDALPPASDEAGVAPGAGDAPSCPPAAVCDGVGPAVVEVPAEGGASGVGNAGADASDGETSLWGCDVANAPGCSDRDGSVTAGPVVITTTPTVPFARSSPTLFRGASADVRVSPSQSHQAIEGFGGAFNEQGWAVLSILSQEARDAVLKALFDPVDGLRLSFGRAPIGASDYALERYTLDEVPNDYAMSFFSIEHDRRLLIPYVQAALRLRPDLKVWASAWTPPTWMKTNGAFDGGALKDDPKIYAAYALYLAKFVEAYRAEGIPVFMVVPQNEPGQLQTYPSCDWSAAQFLVFIRDHLGPLFEQRKVGAEIWLGTINLPGFDVTSILADPRASAHIGGACFQWDGLSWVAPTRASHPTLPIMQSETDCGNWPWAPGFLRAQPPNDFAYAALTWRKFRDFLAAGSSSYMLWNLVLDEEGINLDEARPWPQNSPIVVNRETEQVTYTPMFWATKHYSSLLAPGATLVESTGSFADQIAFRNPDGSTVVELLNDGERPKVLTVTVGAEAYSVSLPATSFATLVVPP